MSAHPPLHTRLLLFPPPCAEEEEHNSASAPINRGEDISFTPTTTITRRRNRKKFLVASVLIVVIFVYYTPPIIMKEKRRGRGVSWITPRATTSSHFRRKYVTNLIDNDDDVGRSGGNTLLPPANQNWAHATNSMKLMSNALSDPTISAIEADILMGTSKPTQKQPRAITKEKIIPIMSHPPGRHSDLTLRSFLELASSSTSTSSSSEVGKEEKGGRRRKRVLQKHLKLDFKEIEGVEPTLHTIEHDLSPSFDFNGKKTIFLNADVLTGPGYNRKNDPRVDGELFMGMVLNKTAGIDTGAEGNNNNKTKTNSVYALSLGWSVDSYSMQGYTMYDVTNMENLIRRHGVLEKSLGLVISVNARILLHDFVPLDKLMDIFPLAELMVWTGHNELPISSQKMKIIKEHYFVKYGNLDRIGFDCNVANSYISGFVYESIVFVVGMFKSLLSLVLRIS